MIKLKNWFELEQKDNETMLLKIEQQKQKKLINILELSLAIIILLFGIIILFYKKINRKNNELKKLHTVKDKLFSVISHDLRSPMNSLLSTLKVISSNMLDANTQNQTLNDISKSVDDTYGLIENLLHWSKNQMYGIVASPAYFNVQEEIVSVLNNLIETAAAKKITLNNYIGNQQVFTDKDMFSVVVRNLITNAIKYTPAGGNITLNAELSENKLIISIQDSGLGMSQDIQSKLFKLSDSSSQLGTNNEIGTGLGLVLCADFVKINGGEIGFYSKEGEGSTFYFSVYIK
jgi:signal transduction histidine kinase